MIFVTVGTHEQPFNRLVEYVDNLKRDGVVTEDVLMQTAYSTYEPKYCRWSRFMPYEDMERNVAGARIVITHGGPASFIMPLRIGKIPIVVPRQYQYGEHINDHQVEFVKAVSARMGTIIPVVDIEKLGFEIQNYDAKVRDLKSQNVSHNAEFNREFAALVDEMCVGGYREVEPALYPCPSLLESKVA